jgi:HSP20 family protein
MLESIRKVGKEIGRELNRTWENLSEGWRELLIRSNNALTHFVRAKGEGDQPAELALARFPNWSLLAGEVMENDKEVVVRLEVPGMEKEDCNVNIEGSTLYVSGEKRFEREAEEGRFHVSERAYGSFRRTIPLPANVDSESATAEYRNGVLTVRMPKTGGGSSRRVSVS